MGLQIVANEGIGIIVEDSKITIKILLESPGIEAFEAQAELQAFVSLLESEGVSFQRFYRNKGDGGRELDHIVLWLANKKQNDLQKSLWYLGQHIRNLEIWTRRTDTHWGLKDCAELVRKQFEEVSKILPPATS